MITYGITFVGDGVHARDTILLQADLWAYALLLLAPVVPGRFLHGIRVDLVLLLGSGQASDGEKAESES